MKHDIERRRIKRESTGVAFTEYKLTCLKCSDKFWADKVKQKFCSRDCFAKNNKIKDPLEKFFREKITRLRGNARKRNIKFDLIWEDLLDQYRKQNGKCFYTGRKLSLNYSTKTRKVCPPDQLSVDRMDSDKHYNNNNISLCCYCINNFKGDSTLEEFNEYMNFINKKPVQVKVKKLVEEVELPIYANSGDAGMDLIATSMKTNVYGFTEYGTSLAVEIPKNHMGLIFPRSSISKVNMALCNGVGVIDSSFRGEIKLRFKPSTFGKGYYQVGDKVGQLIIMPYPEIEWEEVDELSETNRGEDGFGSSGI